MLYLLKCLLKVPELSNQEEGKLGVHHFGKGFAGSETGKLGVAILQQGELVPTNRLFRQMGGLAKNRTNLYIFQIALPLPSFPIFFKSRL